MHDITYSDIYWLSRKKYRRSWDQGTFKAQFRLAAFQITVFKLFNLGQTFGELSTIFFLFNVYSVLKVLKKKCQM